MDSIFFNDYRISTKRYILVAILLMLTACSKDTIMPRGFPITEWEMHTSPLPEETILDLCDRLELEDDDPLCNVENTIYAGYFYRTIKKTIKPSSGEWMNKEQVNDLLGAYLLEECYESTSNIQEIPITNLYLAT